MVDLYNEEVRKLYLVCERQKWCYIAIQKVAGTSVRMAFLEHVGAPHKENWNLRAELEPWRLTPVEVLRRQDLFRWGFIRDPRDRLVSFWVNKIAADKPDPYCSWRVNKYYGWEFKDFVKAVCDLKDDKMDQHYLPQVNFLTYMDLPLYDELYRLDRIDETWKKLRETYGLPDLKHENKTHKKDYRKYYDSNLNRLVLKRYSKDFEIFESLD